MQIKLGHHSPFKLISTPYALLGITGLALGLLSFDPDKGQALDINLHDTYFVIVNAGLYSVFAVFLLFEWSIYIVVNRLMMSNKLIWVQVASCLLPIILFFILKLDKPGNPGPPRRYYAFTEFESRKPVFNFVYVAMLVIFTFGQLIFIINLIGGVIRKFVQIPSLNTTKKR